MNSALVVSHPDDETMWFGGLVLSQPDNWTIFCLSTPRADPIRGIQKFRPACQALGARGLIMRVQEPPANEPFPDDLLGQIDLTPFDRVVTHGREAEYGHVHHKCLHEHIHSKWGHKEIWSTCPPGKSDYDVELVLTQDQLTAKHQALSCYDHVLPYEGVQMTKAAALMKRYCFDGGWPFGIERYRIHRPH